MKKAKKGGCAKYDTSQIKQQIYKKKLTLAAFIRKVSELTGTKVSTINTHIAGYFAPPAAEVKVIAELLGMQEEEIAATFAKKDDNFTPPEGKMFDFEALEKATANAGRTKAEVCRIIGVNKNSYYNWQRNPYGPCRDTIQKICSLLKMRPEDLYKDAENAQEEQKPKADAHETPMAAGFEKIRTKDIHENFEIINNNILLLAKNLDCMARLNEDRHNQILQKIEELTALVKSGANGSTQKPAKPVALPPKKGGNIAIVSHIDTLAKKDHPPVRTTQDEVKELSKGYNKDDDYDKYNKKINRMVALINTKTKDTQKQTLHKFYEEMTRVYGVNFTDLGIRFRKENGRKNKGTVELIYMEEIFREVFYEIIVTKMTRELLEETKR